MPTSSTMPIGGQCFMCAQGLQSQCETTQNHEHGRRDLSHLGVEGFHTHQVPLEEAPDAYEKFQKKEDGAVKVLLKP